MTVIAESFLVAVVLSLLAIPLFRKVDDEYILIQKLSSEEGDQYHQLLARKENCLEAIKDLTFDYETGKLSEEDYTRTKADFEMQAIEVIKEVEKMKKSAEASHKALLNNEEKKTESEKKPAAAFCHHCGSPLKSSGFKFCPSCGKPLTA